MRLAELAEAVVIPDDGGNITDEDRLINPQELLRACGSLISCTSAYKEEGATLDHGYVLLGHSSVREYLTAEKLKNSSVAKFYCDPKSADTIISKLCLNYLLQQELSEGYCPSYEDLSSRMHRLPLLRYTKDTLWEHLFYVDVNGPLQPLLSRFLASQRLPGAGNFGAWVQTFYGKYRSVSLSVLGETTGLYFAAREGLLPLLKMILSVDGAKDLEKPGGLYMSTPLHVAAWAGHTSIVAELVNAGANVHERNSEGTNGLYWAILSHYTSIERLLRDAGAMLDDALDRKLQRKLNSRAVFEAAVRNTI